jgi:ABC-2 type transport system permease protein
MMTHQHYISLMTIVRKEVVRFFRIWTQTLLPSVITQSLYFLIFGKFIGHQIGDIQGIDYMSFIVPGLIMMAIINNSFANVVSSFFSSKFQRNVEELLVSSTPNWVILAGYTIGGVLRGVIVGLLVFGVSVFFTHPKIYQLGLILLFIFLTSVLFSLGGFLNAIFAKKFDDVAIFPTFVLTPLTYLGGVFYSIHSLPMFWRHVSQFNPILYMVDGFRYGFHGISDVNVLISISLLVVMIVILVFVNLRLLNKGTGLKA